MTAKLFKTLRDGNIDELEELIAKGAQVNEADKKGYTPLMECAGQGFAEGISVLLAAGAKSSAKDKKEGRTALTVATCDGQDECVTELLKDPNAADVINSQDAGGLTALHWALKLQQDDIANQLIAHSAIKLDIVAKNGYTPLMCAVQAGNEEIVQTLLKHPGAKSGMNATDKAGNNLLHLAALMGNVAIAQAVFSAAPALLSAQNSNGETPLHLAATENNIEVVKWFIAQGADLKALTKDGCTPYQVADPDSQSAQAIAEITGEIPDDEGIEGEEEEEGEGEGVEEEEEEEQEEEITLDEPEIVPDEPKTGVRKRPKFPAAALSTKKGKNEEYGNPLIARLLLVLVLGSSLTYILTLLF